MRTETELKNPIFAPVKTREFFLAAYADGAVQRYLTDRNTPDDVLTRRALQYNLSVIYFATPNTYSEIGLKYNLSREGVRQFVKKTSTELHSYLTPKLQSDFPLPELTLNKNNNVDTLIARGLQRGEKSAMVADLVRKGKSHQEISALIGDSDLRSIGLMYQKFGIVTPYSEQYLYAIKLREDLANPNLSQDQVEAVFSGSNDSAMQTNHDLVSSLVEFTIRLGLSLKLQLVSPLIPYLEQAGVAIGHYTYRAKKNGKEIVQNYYFIRRVDFEKAEAALKKAPELEELFKTTQLTKEG